MFRPYATFPPAVSARIHERRRGRNHHSAETKASPRLLHYEPLGPEIFTTGFPVALDFLLNFLPPTGPAEAEKPLRERFASIGIGPAHRRVGLLRTADARLPHHARFWRARVLSDRQGLHHHAGHAGCREMMKKS